MKRLRDKVAVVTGAARGIGYGIARKFVDEGAFVIIADILDEGQESANKLGNMAAFYKIDLIDRNAIFKMSDFVIKKYKKIDILINCAGVALPKPTLYITENELERVIAINLKAPFYCCQAFGKYMIEQGSGSIVNISSGNSKMINVGRTPYGITKGGINLLTKQLGAEWSMYGVKCNAIAPGWIETEMVKKPISKGILNSGDILSVSPIRRFGKVEEIANLATFLSSDESNYIVGQVIFADGGRSLGIMPDALDFVEEYKEEKIQ